MVVTTRSMMERRFGPFEEPSVSLSSSIGTNPPPHTSPSGLPPGSTRLVRLHPSSVLHDPIQVSLVEISLFSYPEYECLSYTWATGDSDSAASSAIDVDGKKVMIRNNLVNALCRLRLVDHDRLLWVDALSINQTDLEEKAQQVAMIGKIFQKSVRVLAWVGEHSDNSELMFTLTKEMQDLGAPKWRQPCNFSRRKDIICAWSSFLERRYFHRVWTYQEVVCHRDVLVCCGPDDATWEDLITQRFRYKDFGIDIRYFNNLDFRKKSFREGLCQEEADRWIRTTENVRDLVLALENYVGGAGKLLLYVVLLRQRKCSDRRDRVYAVVSLVRDDAVAASIGTDYNISIPDLCYKVMTVTSRRTTNGALDALLNSLRCDHNEYGSFVDLMLDTPNSAIMDDWNEDVVYLLSNQLLTDYEEPRTGGYPEPPERKSHLLSWRTAARQRGTWPGTSGTGVYPPFQSWYSSR